MSDEVPAPEALDDEEGEFTLRELATDGPLLVYTPSLASVSLEGWYAGRSCFLLGAGPSLGRLNLSLLRRRGIVTMGLNNAWRAYRPNLWMACDSAEHFPDAGWRDPGITKFVPLASMGKRLMDRTTTGRKATAAHVRDMPAVWGFRRRCGFEPSTFFSGSAVTWGNARDDTDRLGFKGGRSTMLAALRVLVYLGFSRIYLAGCDFKAPEQPLRELAFRTDNGRLASLVPYLEELGVAVFNTTEDSGLTAFPYKPFTVAIEEATRECARPIPEVAVYDEGDGTPSERGK